MTERKSVWFAGRWRTPEGIAAYRERDRVRQKAKRNTDEYRAYNRERMRRRREKERASTPAKSSGV